jgi:hypothetical protein
VGRAASAERWRHREGNESRKERKREREDNGKPLDRDENEGNKRENLEMNGTSKAE